MKKICLKCGKEFYKKITCSKKEWETSKFCSHSCANSVNANPKGLIKYTNENGVWNKGKSMPKGKDNPRYTRIEKQCLECSKVFIIKNYRKDIAQFCSKECASKYRDNGKTDINYRIRRSVEFKNWRELVFERDNWTCQKCLTRSGNGKTIDLNPHHILNFSEVEEKRFNIDNGITFCRDCHYDFHSEYGFRNNTREQLEEFLAVANEA